VEPEDIQGLVNADYNFQQPVLCVSTPEQVPFAIGDVNIGASRHARPTPKYTQRIIDGYPIGVGFSLEVAALSHLIGIDEGKYAPFHLFHGPV
jgi:hypothetical protein